MANKEPQRTKLTFAEIGRTVPANLKFGIIVSIVILWTQFFRALLDTFFSFLGISGPMLSAFITAAAATFLAYIVLLSYQKIASWLEKTKV